MSSDLEKLDISSIMGTEAGRRFVYRVLCVTEMDVDTFSPDPYVHAMRAGRRSVGVEVAQIVKDVVPGSYAIMLKEHEDV